MQTYAFKPGYPTREHEQAARQVVDYFRGRSEVSSVLLTGSCARGKASPDSCLDMAILLRPEVFDARLTSLSAEWEKVVQAEPAFAELRRVGAYSNLEVEFLDGRFDPDGHGWTSGPDQFELAIGNLLVYCAPLLEQDTYFHELRQQWLPYYGEEQRSERMRMVRGYLTNNLDHIRLYVPRGLYFQSFHRLWHAFGEFLQLLFISRRTYPIAYDKWVREQVVEVLGLPDLYARLPRLFEIGRFESDEIWRKAEDLYALLEEYVPESG